MRCPYCGSVVEPARDTSGALFCPACQNTGKVTPVWPPLPNGGAGAVLSPGAAPAAPAATPGKAVAALVLGICGITFSPLGLLLGPLAIVFAVQARRELKRLPAGTPGQGMSISGLVLGSIAIVISLVTAVVLVAGFFFAEEFGEPERELVEMRFEVDAEGTGGVLRLSNVTGTDEFSSWFEYELAGTARCTLPNGDIDVGDEIVCVTDGDVVLSDWGDERVVYSATV